MTEESVEHRPASGTHATEARFSFDGFPLDRHAIASAVLNIEEKARSNYFPWNGQFSPQFVEAILSHYAEPGQLIYDPFCGSGTVLSEAGRLHINAVGSEVNPAAFLLARVYTLIMIPVEKRKSILRALEKKITDFAGADGLFASPDIREHLLRLATEARDEAKIVAEALVILVDLYKGASADRVWKSWLKLKAVVLQLPAAKTRIAVELRDCRSRDIGDRQVDLVLTSPPYINVYNYHQQYRASAEALGWDLLAVAKSEIGSNRKHRGNRFLTVVQYCLDMAECLRSIGQMMADNGRMVFVMGRESRVRGVPFLNGELAARLGVEALGYRLLQRQERVFTNRFGQRIFEDIVHLERGHEATLPADAEACARTIAVQALRAAEDLEIEVPVRTDLEDAIDNATKVAASPHFGGSADYKKKQ